MNLPRLVPEAQINPFTYYWEGKVRPAITTCGRLYGLLGCFSEKERTFAYERGCQLSDKHKIVMTVSKELGVQYRLWVELSTATDASLLSEVGLCCRACEGNTLCCYKGPARNLMDMSVAS